MKRLARYLLFCACSAAVIWTFAARTDASAEVARETLTNGLKVVVVKNTLAPVVATVMNYLAGSNEAPPGFPGMAHSQEHMMFRGSPGLSQAQLANLIAAMGGNANADTQESITRQAKSFRTSWQVKEECSMRWCPRERRSCATFKAASFPGQAWGSRWPPFRGEATGSRWFPR